MIYSIDQLITQIHNDRTEKTVTENVRRPRARWTEQEDELFEQLVARFGSDYRLLGSFLPAKSQKQIRKRHRLLLRYRSCRLERLEKEITAARRKNSFDQILQECELSSSVGSHSPSHDELSQSLQWGARLAASL